MKRTILLLILLLTLHILPAQTFRVDTFRWLQHDITAGVNPVRDLNDEECALLKVVGDPDFVFSSPLGIVLRQEKVGEIWLYLPRGTSKITIKHPRWGVWGDYRFPETLMSRMTYELVLLPPPSPPGKQASPYPKIRQLRWKGLPQTPREDSLLPMEKDHRHHSTWLHWAALVMGWGKSHPSWGVMVGSMQHQGGYLHLQHDFHSISTVGSCDETGRLNSGEVPYYQHHVQSARVMLLAGITQHLGKLCFLYGGMGWGHRKVVWETIEGKRVEAADSEKGWAGELGVQWHFGRLSAITGIMTIRGAYWEPLLGIGLNF